MNISLLLNTPLFWPTVFFVPFFIVFAVWAARNPRKKDPYDRSINPAITASFIFLLAFWYLWSNTGEFISWSLQTHQGLWTTEGRIVHSTTEIRGGKGVSLHYVIRFEYTVDGKRYESDRVSYGYTGLIDKSFATAYVAKYPVGKTALVYYDPLEPQKGVLEPDVKQYNGFLLLLLMLSMEVFFLVDGISQKLAQHRVQRIVH